MEEARGLQNLIIDHKFTQEQLAAKLGKSQSAIANKLRILKLPELGKKVDKGGKSYRKACKGFAAYTG
jgi:ParB family chromosome partitioning protein